MTIGEWEGWERQDGGCTPWHSLAISYVFGSTGFVGFIGFAGSIEMGWFRTLFKSASVSALGALRDLFSGVWIRVLASVGWSACIVITQLVRLQQVNWTLIDWLIDWLPNCRKFLRIFLIVCSLHSATSANWDVVSDWLCITRSVQPNPRRGLGCHRLIESTD